MDAEQFYQSFKDALVFLDVRWGEMDQVNIEIRGSAVVFTCGAKTASFFVGENK